MLFTVSIDATTHYPLTADDIDALLDRLVDFGASVSGTPGGSTVGTTMTVEASDALLAGAFAVARISDVMLPKLIVGCEAVTVDEFDRRHAIHT